MHNLSITSLDSCYSYNWVTVNGTHYTRNMVIMLDFEVDSLPKFALIENLYVVICNKNEKLLFECSLFETLFQ